jgi:hypothetical protein
MVRRYSGTANSGGVVVRSDESIRAEEHNKRVNARLVLAANARGNTKARRRGDLKELLDMLGLLTDEQDREALDYVLSRQATRALSLANDPSFQTRASQLELAEAN